MDGSGNPIVVEADCGVSGRIFSAGSCELAILATQWHAQVMPPCHCVANSVRLAVEYREIVATGVDFGLMALSEISARGGAFGFGRPSKGASPACSYFLHTWNEESFFFGGAGILQCSPYPYLLYLFRVNLVGCCVQSSICRRLKQRRISLYFFLPEI